MWLFSALIDRLEEAGYGVGQRVLELVAVREKYNRRETRVVQILQYISNNIWKYLFGKNADSLERSMENEDECAYWVDGWLWLLWFERGVGGGRFSVITAIQAYV